MLINSKHGGFEMNIVQIEYFLHVAETGSFRKTAELMYVSQPAVSKQISLLEKECTDQCRVSVMEAECYDEAWEDWFNTGHEYGIRDRMFLSRGLDRILNFVLIYVRKK